MWRAMTFRPPQLGPVGNRRFYPMLEESSDLDPAYRRDIQNRIKLAIQKGDLASLKGVIDKYGRRLITSSVGYTLLRTALRLNHRDIAKFLISVGVPVNSKSTYQTPLFTAVEQNDEEITELLLQRGAATEIVAPDDERFSPLLVAVNSNNLKITKLLVRYGADVNFSDSFGETALSAAVRYLPKEIVAALLESPGANVNAGHCITLLHQAVLRRDVDIVRLLLEHRPSVMNLLNRRAYFEAVDENMVDMCDVLVNYGFSFIPGDVKNVMFIAIRDGQTSVFEKLLSNVFHLSLISDLPAGRSSALHYASKYKRKEMAELLLPFVPDVDAEDDFGNIPLFYAIGNDDIEMFNLLVPVTNVKAHPNLLRFSVMKRNIAFARELLRYGVDVNSVFDFKRESSLHIASRYDAVDIVQLLLDYDADVNLTDREGKTALFVAAREGFVATCEVLLKEGADVNATGAIGKTPLHIAVAHGRSDTVKLLLDYRADPNIFDGLRDSLFQFSRFGRYEKPQHERKDFSWEASFDLVLKHLLKLRALNFSAYYASLDCLPCELFAEFRIENEYCIPSQIYRRFVSECEKEVVRMKGARVKNCTFSFYDLLTADVTQLSKYARNQVLGDSVLWGAHEINFPVYASMIESAYNFGKRRRDAEEEGWELFSQQHLPRLPDICLDKIFGYLSDLDIKKVLRAKNHTLVFNVSSGFS